MPTLNNPEGNLVFYGGLCFTNNKSAIDKTNQRAAAPNAIFADEYSRSNGAGIANIKVLSRNIGLKGEIRVPQNLINSKSLYDITKEYDRDSNRRGRYLRFMRYYKTISELNDATKFAAGNAVQSIANDDLDYQLGTRSIKFTINPSGSAIQNGDFSTFTGSAGDNTTDIFSAWTNDLGAGAYIDAVASNGIKMHRASAKCEMYQDLFLNANTKYMLSIWTKSDGTGTFNARIQAQDGSTHYVQDDGTTWNVTVNEINDLTGLTTDTQYYRRNFEFTTKNYTGWYRLMLANPTNTSDIYVKKAELVAYSAVYMMYPAFNDIKIFNRAGVQQSTTQINANARVMAVKSIASTGNTFVVWQLTSDTKLYVDIYNKLGAAVVQNLAISAAGGFDENNVHCMLDSQNNLHVIYTNTQLYYTKVSSAGSVMVPYTQFASTPNSMSLVEYPVYNETTNKIIVYGSYWTGSATRHNLWELDCTAFTIANKWTDSNNYPAQAMQYNSLSGKYFMMHTSGSTVQRYMILNSDFTVNTASTILRTAAYQFDDATICQTSDGRIWMFYCILESNSDRRIYWRVLDKDGASIQP